MFEKCKEILTETVIGKELDVHALDAAILKIKAEVSAGLWQRLTKDKGLAHIVKVNRVVALLASHYLICI